MGFCLFSNPSAALDYWDLSILRAFKSFHNAFCKCLSSGTPSTLYSSANGALLYQHLPTVLLSSLKCRLVGATDWSSFGFLSFMHWKKKYFISHPSQSNLNGCANTKIIQWCLLHVPITNRFLPVSFYKLIYTGSMEGKQNISILAEGGGKITRFPK